MFTRFLAVALLGTATACSAQTPASEPAGAFQVGRDYHLIEPAQPTASGERIEVVEVFGYSCGACASFQPLIDEWSAKQADDVAFSYTPAMFGGIWDTFGRAFYTAETMGLLDKTHNDMFKAVHVERRIRTEGDIPAFYTNYGVKADEFAATMNSFAVNAKTARAQQQAPRYGVTSTPTLIVAGKYRVEVGASNSHARMLQVVDQLVAKERAERAAKADPS